VTLSSGRRASAITWAEGHALGVAGKRLDLPVNEILDLYHRLGSLLARLHQATDTLILPDYFARPRWDIPGLVGQTPFWGRFWDHPLASADQRVLLRQSRIFLDERLTRHLAGGASFGLIHADVLRENILVQDKRMTLIDFDDSGYGFRLYDLGTALLHCLIEPAFFDIRDALMAGYGTQDIEMVDTFTLARSCASVGWIMPRLAHDSPIHQSHLATACKIARRVLDQGGFSA
jgi:Ser/Thr protein kinase RdoA (MazF antagonist)